MKKRKMSEIGQVLRDLKKLSRPRFPTTEAEKDTAVYIEQELTGLGFTVDRQSFPVAGTWFTGARLFVAGVMFSGLTAWAYLILWPDLEAWIFIPTVSLLLLASILSLKYFGRLGASAGSLNSINLFARLPGSDCPSIDGSVLLVAHMDSKSQYPSLIGRTLCLILLFLGSGGLLILSIPAGLDLLEIELLQTVPFLVVILIGGLQLVLIKSANLSPGAIDNASGLAVLLNLARYLSRHRPEFKELQAAFLFTGAEELGLEGARAFFKDRRKELARCRDLTVINVDGPGGGSRPVAAGLRYNGRLARGLKEAARSTRIKPWLLPWLDFPSDHLVFRRYGAEVGIISSVSTRVLRIHTRKDNLQAVDLCGIIRIIRWLRCYLESMRPESPCV